MLDTTIYVMSNQSEWAATEGRPKDSLIAFVMELAARLIRESDQSPVNLPGNVCAARSVYNPEGIKS